MSGQPAGVVYGVGVGPGDPELLTLKAVRLLGACPVVAYPTTESGDALAHRIAAPHIARTAEHLPFLVPMREARGEAQAVYDRTADLIARHVDDGRDVAVLCEGDPFFYGSFMYLASRLAPAHRVIVVPGVSAVMACAAALGRPLAARMDRMSVIPATCPADDINESLRHAEAAAIIKVGRHFEKVRDVLDARGLTERAFVVEHASTAEEKLTPVRDFPVDRRPYFSTILVYSGGEPW